MEIPTYILFVLGCLGAMDIALFHSLAHGIRSHPDSVTELAAHSLRGPVYATLFVLIPNFILHGVFIWGVLALFLIDVAISIWDFALEQHSRRFLGGLPSGEYVLHMLMAIVFGALMASFLHGAKGWLSAPARLLYAPAAVPIALRFVLFVMAALVLVSGMQDAIAAVRLRALGVLKADHPQAERTQPLQISRPALDRTNQVAKAPEGQPLGWMRFVLAAAGIYNVLWGAWAILFPQEFFRWAGGGGSQLPANLAMRGNAGWGLRNRLFNLRKRSLPLLANCAGGPAGESPWASRDVLVDCRRPVS